MRREQLTNQSNQTDPNRWSWVSPVGKLVGLLLISFLIAFGVTRWRADQARTVTTPPPPGMRSIPAGEFTMGTDSSVGWPEEHPAHPVRVDGFLLDEHEVTNAMFRAFVEATGYITTAETAPDIQAIMAQVLAGNVPAAVRESCPWLARLPPNRWPRPA